MAIEHRHVVQQHVAAQPSNGRLQRSESSHGPLRQRSTRLLERRHDVQRLCQRLRRRVDVDHPPLLKLLDWVVIMAQLADADDGLVWCADVELHEVLPEEHVADEETVHAGGGGFNARLLRLVQPPR